MSGAVQPCASPPEPETICERLAREIDEFINRRRGPSGGIKGLRYRFEEQIAPGAQGPGTTGWTNHERAISEQQKGLRDRLDDYDDNDCDDKGPPLPSGARNWAFRPVPSAGEWSKNNPVARTVEEDSGLIDKVRKATGLTGVALALYLIVSEGSRVVFPPRNLVPVP
ncbi:MAG: hypothetical protein EOP21_11165 [Hyphomicrobiales bacterium]|nr:MAG: hypothetical protein EOP21_11165 [Hyphomicrobiales bacterium]